MRFYILQDDLVNVSFQCIGMEEVNDCKFVEYCNIGVIDSF